MVLPRQGLNGLGMSLFQVEESQLGKELIGPAVVIRAAPATLATASLAENAP